MDFNEHYTVISEGAQTCELIFSHWVKSSKVKVTLEKPNQKLEYYTELHTTFMDFNETLHIDSLSGSNIYTCPQI